MASSITEVPYFSSKVKLGKNGEQTRLEGSSPALLILSSSLPPRKKKCLQCLWPPQRL